MKKKKSKQYWFFYFFVNIKNLNKTLKNILFIIDIIHILYNIYKLALLSDDIVCNEQRTVCCIRCQREYLDSFSIEEADAQTDFNVPILPCESIFKYRNLIYSGLSVHVLFFFFNLSIYFFVPRKNCFFFWTMIDTEMNETGSDEPLGRREKFLY